MFTGIIQGKGKVESLGQDGRLALSADMFAETAANGVPPGLGDSIAVNGVCLTVTSLTATTLIGTRLTGTSVTDTSLGGTTATFDLSSETLRRTSLGQLKPGDEVNLERALRLGDRLDGHLVQGHVDAVSEVLSIADEGETRAIKIRLVDQISEFIAEKGSVCIDGISLTIGEVKQNYFAVYIIPHTAAVTTIGQWSPGRKVNLEADCIARYVARSLAVRGSAK